MNLDPQEVLSYDLKQLWTIALIMKEDNIFDSNERAKMNQAKDGIKIKFHIKYILHKYYEEYPSSKKAKILGHGKYPIQDFWEEIDKRKGLLTKIIINNIEEGNPLEGR